MSAVLGKKKRLKDIKVESNNLKKRYILNKAINNDWVANLDVNNVDLEVCENETGDDNFIKVINYGRKDEDGGNKFIKEHVNLCNFNLSEYVDEDFINDINRLLNFKKVNALKVETLKKGLEDNDANISEKIDTYLNELKYLKDNKVKKKILDNKKLLNIISTKLGDFSEYIVYNILNKVFDEVYYESAYILGDKLITPDFSIITSEGLRLVEVKLNKSGTSFTNKFIYKKIDSKLLTVYIYDNDNANNNHTYTNTFNSGGDIYVKNLIKDLNKQYPNINFNDELNAVDEVIRLVERCKEYGLFELVKLNGNGLIKYLNIFDKELSSTIVKLGCMKDEVKVKQRSNKRLGLNVKTLELRLNKINTVLKRFTELGLGMDDISYHLEKEFDVSYEDSNYYYNAKTINLDMVLELEYILNKIEEEN